MSKWTHVFVGPSDVVEGIEADVTSIAAGSPVAPEHMRAHMPELNTKPGCERVRYVGSGKGDWWDRTMNSADPLVERFQIRNLTAGMIPMAPLAPACHTERLP